ncbi:rhodanese-like domain-containing protein [Companilactobacillus keshanensis]|uniref:Rhodanese-like domain-containing protein n=1 Tax=Companilactobacillus keshanensis TaxID=2486003 RepID=A0ABW4BWE3_9LACO|nr:rhodanese-like domain-containing protein [Companilactobacillus keshanensis]
MSIFTKIDNISIDDFHKLLPEHPNVIDVRFPEEYEAGHIPGAINVPYKTIKHFEPKGKTYIMCHSGVNSVKSAKKLTAKGYDVVNIEGGMIKWTYDVNKGKEA